MGKQAKTQPGTESVQLREIKKEVKAKIIWHQESHSRESVMFPDKGWPTKKHMFGRTSLQRNE